MGAAARQLGAGRSFKRRLNAVGARSRVTQPVRRGHSDCAGSPWGEASRPLGLASLWRRHFGGLGQEAGIIRSENDPAKSDGGLHLRLAERPIGRTRVTQRIEQYFGAALKMVLHFRIAPRTG